MAKRSKVNFSRQTAASNTVKLPKPNVEQGATSVGSVRSPHRQSVANSLTPQRLGSLFVDADRGNTQALYALGSEVLEREPHIISVLNTRTLAVTSRDIVVDSASESAHDKAIADAVYELVRKPEMRGLVTDLMSAVYYGFAAVEIVWDRKASEWLPARYEFREPRHFVWDANTLSKPLLRTDANTDGEELNPNCWLIHAPRTRAGLPLQVGLIRPLALTYALKRFTVQQLMIFLETLGVPMRLGKYQSHQADLKDELLDAVRRIGTDAAAVVPAEMDITLLEPKSASGNSGLFLANFEYWDETISKLVLGALMAVDQGSSQAQALVHADTGKMIRDADAVAIAATLNRDLIRPFIDFNFGPQGKYPTVRIDVADPEDTKSLMETVTAFVSLGGEVEMVSLRDRLGLPEPAPGAQLLRAPGQAATPVPADNSPDEDTPPQLARIQAASEKPDTTDEIDNLVSDALDDWRAIVDPVIGEAIRRVQAAETYEDAQRILAELEADEGDVLDLTKVVESLARWTLQTRGIGDSSDNANG